MIKGHIPVIWKPDDYLNVPEKSRNHWEPYGPVPDVFYNVMNQFGLTNPTVGINSYQPGQIIPWHADTYKVYREDNNIPDDKQIARIIVFLHDQKAGHQLWIEDQICIGNAGAYFGWIDQTEHMAGNVGHEARHVLQITGVDENKQYK